MTAIAILGAGKAGTSLARIAVAAGHDVAIAGSGHPDRIRLIVEVLVPGARVATAADAVRGAELVFVAVPLGRFRSIPADLLAGKTVVDMMNYWEPVDGRLPEFDDAPEGSSVIVAEHFAASHVVKSLNHLGYHEFEQDARPAGDPQRRAVAAAGDERAAVQSVLGFIDAVGFDPVDAGPLVNGVALQPGSPLFGAALTADAFRAELGRIVERLAA